MVEDLNLSGKEASSKHATRPNDSTDADRSPRSDAESKLCSHGTNARNLIVCIDGTANQFGEKNTNVIELYNLILKEDEHNQRTWYNSGIGTYARPSWKSFKFYRQVLSHKIDLAIAWNFERTILAAYRWLSDNYQSGDCIYLFGFSRGAYQVRVLSAMIDKVGLIYKGNETQIPFAYELYSDPKSHSQTVTGVGSSQTHDENKMSMAERFKKAFSYKDVTVHFVGVWDTVSSIGIARGKHMLPGTIDGMRHVCYFRHALALDERRAKFLPEYAYGGSATCPTKRGPFTGSKDNLIVVEEPSFDRPLADNEAVVDRSQVRLKSTTTPPQTIEVWFAGTHSDIGGGNVENTGMDRSRPPLRWMVFEAGALGLRTAPFGRELSPDQQIEIQESLTWLWWPLELFPFKRLTYTRREQGKQTTHKPHLGASRKIHAGQKIHSSLTLSNNTKYIPKAHPLDNNQNFWEKERTGLGDWLEFDLYEYTQTLVKSLVSECPGTALQTLRQTAMWADGLQAVYDGVIKALRDSKDQPEEKYRLLHASVDILGRSAQAGTSLKLTRSVEIHPLVSDLLESNVKKCRKVVRQFLAEFTDCCLIVIDGHTDEMNSVAFSADGGRIVSGSRDRTIRVWDAETGKQVGEPFRGHTHSVRSVAFSPDGKRVVSGSWDRTVRIWDVEMGKQVGEPFRGHTDWVWSVAFSPDGKRIASGSGDRRVQIWDAETGEPLGEPFRGHTDWIMSVAFSPDGKRIVSGSSDRTVRIWDAETGKPVREPFRGHTNWVVSVTFSPDGRRVLSGSGGDTIRIWDAETGKPVGEPFRGPTEFVYSVAISPDGRHVVSGSGDDTIRIWDVETGKPVGDPFRGHTRPVNSVSFSPDGKRVVSGSIDKTIRIWNAEVAETIMENL